MLLGSCEEVEAAMMVNTPAYSNDEWIVYSRKTMIDSYENPESARDVQPMR